MIANLPKISLAISLGIQAALSIVIIHLYTQRQHFIAEYDSVSIDLAKYKSAALPEGLNRSGSRLNLANAILALLTSVALVIMILIANGRRKRVSYVLQMFCVVFEDRRQG
jgi:hypothetical protein